MAYTIFKQWVINYSSVYRGFQLRVQNHLSNDKEMEGSWAEIQVCFFSQKGLIIYVNVI